MRNKLSVPAVVHRVAPDDADARRVGAQLEALFRREIVGLRHLANNPQPRWLFDNVQRDVAMSPAQLFRAFAILTQCKEIAETALADAMARFSAMATSLRPSEDACLATLHLEETQAQGDADVLQLHATLCDGKDAAHVERAFSATVRQVVATTRLQARFARMLHDVRSSGARRFVGRTVRS